MVNNKKLSKEDKIANNKVLTRENNLNYDLFDNPMTRNILKTMSPEDINKYRKIGEELYGNIDFQKSEVIKNTPVPMDEALAYIKVALKSGIEPEDLEKEELDFLTEYFGDDWKDKLLT